MKLYSYYLSDVIGIKNSLSIKDIESKLNIKFSKSIEGSLFFEQEEKIIFVTKFNVITFVGYEKEYAETFLLKFCGISNLVLIEQEDYQIILNKELAEDWKIEGNEIILKRYSSLYIQIIAFVVSQSVGLEKYEIKMEDFLKDSSKIMQNYNHSIFNRKKLTIFLKELSLMRHDMWNNLLLLDKPNIVWENEDIEKLYNKLDTSFEIKSRYDIIEYKLRHLKDDIQSLMDFISHKHSEFLEWIIIWLITFEIIMSFFKTS